MKQFQCPKCNIIFNKKSNLTRHTNKIYDCIEKGSMNNNLSEFAEINQNLPNLTKINPNLTKINQNSPNISELKLNSSNNEIFLQSGYEHGHEHGHSYSNILKSNFDNLTKTKCFSGTDETTFSCSFCNKKMVNKYTLLRHLKDRCKVKKSIEEEKENTFKMLLEIDKKKDDEINELKKQNKLFEEQNKLYEEQNKLLINRIDKLISTRTNSKPSKIINNNQKITNNTQNNNIVLVNFGKEDLKIIDEREFIDRIVKLNKISGVKIPDGGIKNNSF